MKNADEITVAGEVVNANCCLHVGMRGNDHKQCAITCAKAGAPLAILTNTEYFISPWLVVGEGKNPNKDFMDYIADKVEVKEQYFSYSATKGIFITSVKKSE